ncbi:peptidyl-prolyl cis-trans isomerase-related [Holotrichia oblita]|uniref:Peptidyl-prolyl cis-trans isomerase-related n=1 Tax=Holotrichia oblita TaxID=644536 RepID=A0ACB9T1N4_HOLOL|nr:peptidyl-prolyl cis-trans isomerase-related [Holotrichia oblita]
MGKRQHQKDKLYLTYTEWTTLYGGKVSGERPTEEENAFKRLPFDHCCVSLQPWEHPYCDLDGNIFDLQALIPFLKKFKTNPVTGKPLDMKSLIKLNFHRNAEKEIHCPVLFKNLTKHSHIAAIATTGNVYSMEAIEQLNIKNKNWKDLINDAPFERKDVIVLQDPNSLAKFNITTFHHVKNNLRVETEEELADKSDPTARLKSINPETKYTLEELNRDYKEPTIEINKKKSTEKADKFNAAHYSTGTVAASFTSTVMETQLIHEPAIIHEDLVRYERVKKKGYVRLITNFGPLNLELYCDVVPKTCENFIKHAANGYYNGTKFHRSIRNFMIQGGDPTNTGRGGKSIWGKKFEDEFKQNLSHTGRGVLSMANSGPNTNSSQFFITYRSCKHLDNKHTIFGKVVGGMETLSEMEKIEVDNKDRPIEDIILIRAQVFVDPFEEADEQLNKERQEELVKQKEEEMAKRAKMKAQKSLTVYKSGIGKYINPNINKSNKNNPDDNEPENKKKKVSAYNFNFSNW